MRIRVIVEDDDGKVLGEGSVPINATPDPMREMFDRLQRIADEMQKAQPYVPVYPQPFIPQYPQPQYPQPWYPLGPYYGDPPYPNPIIWCTVTTSDTVLLDDEGNTDPPPTDTTSNKEASQ